jgi:hypothetical protein
MDWQPIETAPKDGTRFLAYFPSNGGLGFIHRHDPGGKEKSPKHNYECWVSDNNLPCHNEPSHWTLPEPPGRL